MGIDSTTVALKSFTTTERLEKIVLETAVEDLQSMLRQIAATAIIEQRDAGNPPTSLLVDNRSGKDIAIAERRVQAFFANTDELARAVSDAWNTVMSLTRVASGRAIASYQLWHNQSNIGNISSLSSAIKSFDPAKDYFRIVGPVLVYGRKVYWNPKGIPKFRKKIVARTRQVTIKAIQIRGIMNQVEQSMRRRYRHIAIAEDWVVTAALPKDGRTPALWIGFKRKGTLVRSSGG